MNLGIKYDATQVMYLHIVLANYDVKPLTYLNIQRFWTNPSPVTLKHNL